MWSWVQGALPRSAMGGSECLFQPPRARAELHPSRLLQPRPRRAGPDKRGIEDRPGRERGKELLSGARKGAPGVTWCVGSRASSRDTSRLPHSPCRLPRELRPGPLPAIPRSQEALGPTTGQRQDLLGLLRFTLPPCRDRHRAPPWALPPGRLAEVWAGAGQARPLTLWPLYWFPAAAVTHFHKQSGSQQEPTLQCCRAEVPQG